jgi:hypothetical protein
VPAHPAQHPQLPPGQRVTRTGDNHRARQRGHRPSSATTATRHPAA